VADLNKMARNSAMLNGTTPYMQTGSSRYDEGLKKQYFADQTRLYAQEIGPAASNVYDAMCQGVSDSGDWYDWRKVRIRVSPAATSSTGETMPDDWQKLHIIKPVTIDTVPIGAYLTFAGNTWIVYKGKNMGSVIGDGIIRRCNSVINVLDWYGNIVPVPMSYAKMGTLGNASHATENSIVAKNYISCICQLNQYSRAFSENTRIILGKTAYSMRGVNDFTREFTDDQDSVHLLTFTIERSEPLPQDSLEKQCADYFSFRWEIGITGNRSMNVGDTQQLRLRSVRNGETVLSSVENPISYSYASSDESVLTVDENGLVTATGSGTATITVTLDQNTDISQTVQIEAAEAPSGSYVAFTSTVPERLGEFETAVISASAYLDGQEQSEELTFAFTGAGVRTYGAENVSENTWRVTCYGASNTPLTITASDGNGNSATAQIILTT
jgi:hypothetical protein